MSALYLYQATCSVALYAPADSASSGGAYAGDVSPQAAWDALYSNPKAQLVDVRTDAEWKFVGMPSLDAANKKPLLLSWRLYPDFSANMQFIAQLKAQISSDSPIYFLCKTGGRSREAAIAATQSGFAECYNIASGFEGDANQHQQRGFLNGWKAANLPWLQH